MYTSSTVELNGQKLQFYANAVKIAISSNVIINTGQKIVDTCTLVVKSVKIFLLVKNSSYIIIMVLPAFFYGFVKNS